VLELAKVTDTNGTEVDLSDFVRPGGEEEAPAGEAAEEAQPEEIQAEAAPAEGAEDEAAAKS
jgi:trigger factor